MPLSRIQRLALFGCLTATVGTGAVLGLQSEAWRRWKAERGAKKAEALLQGGAVEAAQRAGIEAWRTDNENPRALRVLIGALGPNDIQNALLLRSRLADLDGTDYDNLSALALSAIATQRFELAEVAIKGLASAPDRQRGVLELRARLHAGRGEFAQAESEARALLKEDPANVAGRLIFALSQVLGRKGPVGGEVMKELEALASVDTVRMEALRGLRQAAVQNGDPGRAIEVADLLEADPRISFNDHLVRAELVVTTQPDRFEEVLKGLTAAAGTHGPALALIVTWMTRHGHAAQITPWLESNAVLPPHSVTAQLIRVDAWAQAREWKKITDFLEKSSWAERDLDYLRLGFLARAWKGQGAKLAAGKAWRSAVSSALARHNAPQSLADAVRTWPDWEEEYDGFLWEVAQRSPLNLPWALSELDARYSARQDTRSLLRVSEAMLEARPDDPAVKNNVAYYSLLLAGGTPRAHRFAEELCRAYPQEATIVSTYVLSLILQDRSPEALALREKLPAAMRDQSVFVPYWALALGKTGQEAKARSVISTLNPAALPREEAALLKAAGLL